MRDRLQTAIGLILTVKVKIHLNLHAFMNISWLELNKNILRGRFFPITLHIVSIIVAATLTDTVF